MNRKLIAIVTLAGLCLPACRRRPAVETEASLRRLAQERLAPLEGKIAVPGLAQPVEVLRDRWGVPHIYARTADDLFFAQGFVAAQDRLYQMEIWRRTGAGELAEVFGPDFVERDRFARLVGFRGDLEAEWQSYSSDTKAICAAFARGVNAYVRHCGDRLPVEFELLGFRPGEWKAEHCLLRIAGLLMTRNITQEIARAEMVAKLGLKATERYLPPEPARRLDPDPKLDLEGLDENVLASYRAAIAIPALEEQAGSNNWVVDGTLSATGKPILANDPHRPVILPSLRYLVHLVGPGWNVIGGGEPALPGVAVGHNERAAWGFTIVPYDVADLYVEQTDPSHPNRYRSGDAWLEMQVERVQIRVKGQAKPAEAELKFTRHGPVIWEDRKRNRAVALRWAGQEPGTAGYLGGLALARVSNWKEFLDAAARWKLPAENLVYADVDGDIGWIAAGLAPVRPHSGLFPVPGHTDQYEWRGYRALADLPQLRNPGQHYIATANHNILPKNYPHALAYDWAPPYRFRRIDEVLRSGRRFTVEDFKRLQHDETSLPARELVRMLEVLPGPLSPVAKKAQALLAGWDQVLSQDSAAAALFEIWLARLRANFVASEVAVAHRDLVARHLPLPQLIALLRLASAADRERVMHTALEEAWKEAEKLLGADSAAWRWGTLHTIEFRHPLANTPARRAVFNLGPVPRGGDAFTPNATSGPGYRQASGASYRQILDLEDWDRSVFTSTPGQSGQPGAPHYRDLLEPWAKGEYAPLVFTRRAVEAETVHRLVLEPAPR
jgi:penicillin amidase